MKKTKKLLVGLLLFICFTVKTYAGVQVLDEFGSNESKKGIVEYSANLQERPGNGADFSWRGAPDQTFLSTVQGLSADASVIYTISGVDKLYVSMYNNLSTYAVENNNVHNQFVLGYKNGAQAIQNKFEVKYSHEDNLLYSLINGGWYSYDEKKEVFSEVKNVPNDIINYCLQIYVSTDKSNWSNIGNFYRQSEKDASAEMGSIKKTTFYYENFCYIIPPTTKYIKITINGFGKLHPKVNILRLAGAKVEGENIIIGEVEVPPLPPIVSSSLPTPPPPNSSSNPNGGANKPSSSKSSSSSKKSSSSKSSSSKASSPKASSSNSSSRKSASSKETVGSGKMTDDYDVNAGYDKNESENSVSKITQTVGAEQSKSESNQPGAEAIAVIYGGVVLIGVVSFVLKLK